MSLTTSLIGAGGFATADIGKKSGWFSVYAGLHKNLSISSTGSGDGTLSAGVSLSTPVGFSIRLKCKVTGTDNNGCPCKD